jgi:hypothetical protein
MRHANISTTMNTYGPFAAPADVCSGTKPTQFRKPHARSRIFTSSKPKAGDMIGIEPITSSMPWYRRKRKLLTAKQLEVGKNRRKPA